VSETGFVSCVSVALVVDAGDGAGGRDGARCRSTADVPRENVRKARRHTASSVVRSTDNRQVH